MRPRNVSHEEISHRAYEIWEQRGRQFNHDGGADDWQRAESELTSQAARESLQGGTEVSNLDRALPSNQRHQARVARHGELHPVAPLATGRTIFILADAGHFRAFVEEAAPAGATSGLRSVGSFELAAGKETYFARDTDKAGQFGAKTRSGAASRGSNDERLGEKEERDRRVVSELAARLTDCLRENGASKWYFAAAPALHNAMLEKVDAAVKKTLVRSVPKDLVHQPVSGLRGHFTAVN